MATLIKNANIAADSWLRLDPAADGSVPVLPEAADLLVALPLWQGMGATLLARGGGRLGVWLDADEDPALIADSLQALDLIAINFPQFTDGRGYSSARLLRERYGWTGELRAMGDIQRDQLHYLSRCGFDAFLLNDGIDPLAALPALNAFSEAYQAAVDRPLPLFRRRHPEAA
ncbi:MAG: DUF934 domain-containing protein [Burkholderiaceae bacterium]|nr:DUF934 domain-containing protein [Burkholderiaceae bacterium]